MKSFAFVFHKKATNYHASSTDNNQTDQIFWPCNDCW